MPRGSRVETWSAAGSGSRNRRGNARDRRIRAATHLRHALGVGFRARRGPVRHRSGSHARGVLLVVPPNRTVMRSHRPRARVRAGRNHPRRARGRQTRGLTGRARCSVTRFAAAATRRRAECLCGRDRGAGDRAVAETGVRKRPETGEIFRWHFSRVRDSRIDDWRFASETHSGSFGRSGERDNLDRVERCRARRGLLASAPEKVAIHSCRARGVTRRVGSA